MFPLALVIDFNFQGWIGKQRLIRSNRDNTDSAASRTRRYPWTFSGNNLAICHLDSISHNTPFNQLHSIPSTKLSTLLLNPCRVEHLSVVH